MRSTCVVMINYAMLHFSNLAYAQYMTLCMRYTVILHDDTSCFLIAESYASWLIHSSSRERRIPGILQVQFHHYHS